MIMELIQRAHGLHLISGAKSIKSQRAEVHSSRFRSKTKTKIRVEKANSKSDPIFKIDKSLLSSYNRLNRQFKDYLTEDFRYDWLFKQWTVIRQLSDTLPVRDSFQVLNWKRVFQSVKSIRIPRTEPYLRKLFNEQYQLDLPESPPVTQADVDFFDEACFERYTSDSQFKIKDPKAFYRALDITLHQSGFMLRPNFKLWSISEAFDTLPGDTSSCYPVMTRKSSSSARSEAARVVKKLLSCSENPSAIMGLLYSHFLVVFHRTQVVIEKLKPFKAVTKIRQVFGLSFGILCLECMLFGNFYNKLREADTKFAVGCTRPQISDIVKRVANSGKRFVICGDFSKFDSTIPPEMVMLYFSCVIQCSRIPGELKTLASCLAHYLTFTPFMGSSCIVRYMVGGNASGMYSTSWINSFCVLLTLQYAHYRYYGTYCSDLSVQGDDFIIAVDDYQFKEYLSEVFTEFGLILNVDKTKVSDMNKRDTITFLGLNWTLGGIPDQSLEWIISHTVYPERSIDGIDGQDRVIFRLCSVIFQISSGPSVFDRIVRKYRNFMQKINASSGMYQIKVVSDDGRLSETNIPFMTLYTKNWTLF